MRFFLGIIIFLTISCSSLLNTRWVITKSFKPFKETESFVESRMLNEKINEQMLGMEIHILKDSIFMIDKGVNIDKGSIQKISKSYFTVQMADGKINKIEYKAGIEKNEFTFILPDGTKLYVHKIN